MSSKFVAEILAGRHDEDLNNIAVAVFERTKADEIDAHWVGKVGGDTFKRSDLTFGALRRFEQVAKKNINHVDVFDLTATEQALLAACWLWTQSKDLEWEAAVDKVDSMKSGEIEFDLLIEQTPPKDD